MFLSSFITSIYFLKNFKNFKKKSFEIYVFEISIQVQKDVKFLFCEITFLKFRGLTFQKHNFQFLLKNIFFFKL